MKTRLRKLFVAVVASLNLRCREAVTSFQSDPPASIIGRFHRFLHVVVSEISISINTFFVSLIEFSASDCRSVNREGRMLLLLSQQVFEGTENISAVVFEVLGLALMSGDELETDLVRVGCLQQAEYYFIRVALTCCSRLVF